jgi:hemerythrin-like domain-containing protein
MVDQQRIDTANQMANAFVHANIEHIPKGRIQQPLATVTEVNAFNSLIADHQQILSLLEQFNSDPNDRSVIDQLASLISKHSAVEEAVLYPLCRWVKDCREYTNIRDEICQLDHLKNVLIVLQHIDSNNSQFQLACEKLNQDIRNHIQMEENQIIPALREMLDQEQTNLLTDCILAAKIIAPNRLSDTPPNHYDSNWFRGEALDKFNQLINSVTQQF